MGGEVGLDETTPTTICTHSGHKRFIVVGEGKPQPLPLYTLDHVHTHTHSLRCDLIR